MSFLASFKKESLSDTIEVDISTIEPAPWNPRFIEDKDLRGLIQSMKDDPDFLYCKPILVRKETRQIYAGSQRWLAAKSLGYATVPVIISDITEVEAKTRNLKDNSHHGTDTSDRAVIAKELVEGGIDLETIGHNLVLHTNDLNLNEDLSDKKTMFTIKITVESPDEAARIFDELSSQGYQVKQTTKKVK